MPRRRLEVKPGSVAELEEGIRAIEIEMEIRTDFPEQVRQEAQEIAAKPQLPERDCTDLPFVTIDPPGARDLDQAMHIERAGDGFVIYYAIADVAAFVRPGGAIDAEAHLRGETLYAPTHRVALHPPELSEGAASLLADQVRPALVWKITLDSSGEGTDAEVFRALVRSRGQYDYAAVQERIDAGDADEVFLLLREVGQLRQQHERERGGVSLPLPEQEIGIAPGGWSLAFRENLPVEGWNEQISLLTGMAAADLMMYAQIGLLRTLPPADPRSIARLRRAAKALDVSWPQDMDYPDFVRTLGPKTPKHQAMLSECTTLLRGAAYAAFDGAIPAQPEHAAIAAEYAHATAPSRRLADRYVGEVCVAICAGVPVPAWVRTGLGALPEVMQGSDRRAGTYERQIVDLVEAGMLAGSVGGTFEGVVIEADPNDPQRGTVMVRDPAVEAAVRADEKLPVGETVNVRVVEADV